MGQKTRAQTQCLTSLFRAELEHVAGRSDVVLGEHAHMKGDGRVGGEVGE